MRFGTRRKVEKTFRPFVPVIFTLLMWASIANNAVAQVEFEAFSRKSENLRASTYDKITVGVSGKLALCSHTEKGSITLDVRGGVAPYTYRWNTNQTTKDRTDLFAGTYTVVITDAAGKKQVENIVIQPPFPLIINPIEKRDATCSSSSNGYAKIGVKIGRGDGYTNKWSNGLVNVWETDQLKAGTYSVTVFDKFNCDVTVSFEIKSASEGLQLSEQLTDISCSGKNDGAVNLTVNGGVAPYSYKWSNGSTSNSLTALKAGLYEVLITDQKGCSLSSSYLIREAVSLEINETISQPTCVKTQDGSISLNVKGGKAPYTYLWNTGATSSNLQNLEPGAYTLKVTDASGCSLERQYNLAAAKTIEISLTQKEDASCKKATGSALIEVSGAGGDYRITWSDGVSGITKRDDLLPGSYTVSAVNTSGCEVSTSFEIKTTIEITARIESMLDVNCAVGSVTGVAWVSIQGGKEPYTIIWKSGEKEMREINFFQSGILKVLIKDASGCTLEVESKVDFPSQNGQGGRLDFNYRKLEITNDPEVQVEQEVIFESMISEEFIAWEWAFGDGNISKDKDPIHRFEAAGEFEVILTAYDIFGCASTESNRIQVSSPAQLVAVPNAFTPNGDGLNDTFIPKIKAVSTFSMDIFNTWGERIYSTIGPESSGWDGTYQGLALPAGNYMYRINYSSRDGKVFEKTGGITLIR